MKNRYVIGAIVVIVLISMLFLTQDSSPKTTTQPTTQPTESTSQPLESVTYTHPSGSGETEKDCFDGICLTRGAGGPMLSTGNIEWACGPCSNVGQWHTEFDQQFKNGCVGARMLEIVGKDICLKTPTSQWDVVFDIFDGGGTGGGFGYTRTLYE